MSATISVPVLWDANDQFIDSNLFPVNIAAIVIGEVLKPAGFNAQNYLAQPSVITLFVKDPLLGGLYLAMTNLEWQAAIRNSLPTTGGSGGTTPQDYSKSYSISSETNTITDAVLSGSTILTITKGGIGLNPVTYSLTASTITFTNNLEDGDIVVVLYKK